ncbi:hypothetical protein [Devosia beringensis]|uniref:hypothetical protein n=1 Tax=Devosia beringensis TaxID=2657486 RepID=UPI00186B5AAC|nr:hypothetical protein [Devosia beringensis]
MPVEETVVRSVVHPRIEVDGVISPQKMMAPGKTKSQGGEPVLALSVGARSLLPTDDDAHGFGCKVAEKARAASQRKFAKKQRDYQRPRDTAHYIGSLDIDVASVEALESIFFSFGVVDLHQKGFEAHWHLEWRPKDDALERIDDDDVATARTDLIDQMFRLLYRPRIKFCDCDADLLEFLTPIGDSVLSFFPEECRSRGEPAAQPSDLHRGRLKP